MEKRDLKEKTKYFALKIFKTVSSTSRNSAFPACAGAPAGRRNPHSAIGKGGFTLIEIIILIVMAGILLPVIIVPFVTGVKSSGKPEMATKAMYLAHEEMEYRTKYNYGQSQLNPTNFTACQASPPSGYQCQYEILYVTSNDLMVVGSVNPPDTKYKRIRVRVNDPDNDTYEIYSVATTFP